VCVRVCVCVSVCVCVCVFRAPVLFNALLLTCWNELVPLECVLRTVLL